ncbi:MAG TPA: HU family DNA-binding protein [Thermosynechococcaceae cyanobacterium]
MAQKANVSKKDTDGILSAMLDAIVESVVAGEKVTLVGFGTFEARERQEREERSSATGKPLKIPAFAAGKLFKDRVAG